jgi:exo-poly-alpha-galacturonosidase
MQRHKLIPILIVCGVVLNLGAVPQQVRRFTVSDYGAVGDGLALNTKFIQKTIDLCSTEGGGTVVIPEGVYVTGAIFLKPGVSLTVERGGVLKGTVNPEDYPQVFTRWEGVEREWTSALINASDMTGLILSGEGVIDGSGDQWMSRYPRNSRELRTGRPRLIAIQNCRNVSVSGLTLKNQACWGLFILYSEDG